MLRIELDSKSPEITEVIENIREALIVHQLATNIVKKSEEQSMNTQSWIKTIWEEYQKYCNISIENCQSGSIKYLLNPLKNDSNTGTVTGNNDILLRLLIAIKENNIFQKINDSIKMENLDTRQLENDPYNKNVKLKNSTENFMNYSKFEIIYSNTENKPHPSIDAPVTMKKGILAGKTALYDEEVIGLLSNPYLPQLHYYKYCPKEENVVGICFPTLFDSRQIQAYMSTEPYEINTLKVFLNSVEGNVLIAGCGLGYAAYRAALKDSVSNITILENDNDIIKLFEKQVKPYFPKNTSVSIEKCDAYDFLQSKNLSQYNYIYLDTWYGTEDMIIPYLKCLLQERKYPNVKFIYWIEKTLFNEIKMCLLHYIQLTLTKEDIYYEHKESINNIAMKLVEESETTISDLETLNRFISDENIKNKLYILAEKYQNNIERLFLPAKQKYKAN